MIQGTGSHVGKTVMTAALCRMLLQDGFRVAPFKAQNMSNNSFVTEDGGEIGRAQAVQAEAAGIAPSVHMNPILLKPSSDLGAQVVVWGKPVKTMQAREYQSHTQIFLPQVRESLSRLMNDYDVVVIEGAGSPAEVNLKEFDIVNMKTAELADAPVILVGDIDRGGVFASFVGTLELLDVPDRSRIKAFLINKFRGDASLLEPGIDFLLQRTGIPTLGVIPYQSNLGILEEDGLSDERILKNSEPEKEQDVLIDVIWLPRISNFTDFAPLDHEKDVTLTYLREVPSRFPDVLILPGTKSTSADLRFLRESGFDRWIQTCAERGVLVVGICGGYQMLGERILDPLGVESDQKEIQGLGLLPVVTKFETEKTTHQIRAIHIQSGMEITAYEIHMGQTQPLRPVQSVFHMTKRGSDIADDQDGVMDMKGKVWGTYLHGIFDSAEFRRFFLSPLRNKKGVSAVASSSFTPLREDVYDRLADLVRTHMSMNLFYQILNRQSPVQV